MYFQLFDGGVIWTVERGKRGFDCNKQMVKGGNSPQLRTKGSEERIVRKRVTERIKDEVQLSL